MTGLLLPFHKRKPVKKIILPKWSSKPSLLHYHSTALGPRILPSFQYALYSRAYERHLDFLLDLPTELIQQIIRQLSCSDILNVVLTCHGLKNIGDSTCMNLLPFGALRICKSFLGPFLIIWDLQYG